MGLKAQGSGNDRINIVYKPGNPPDNHVLQEDPKGPSFAKAIRNALVGGAPASLNSVVASFYRPGLRVGEDVIE